MGEKVEYLIAALDFYLVEGMEPADAWNKALASYAYVYHTNDGRLPLARAAEMALQQIGEEESKISIKITWGEIMREVAADVYNAILSLRR